MTEVISHQSGISDLSFDDPWVAAGSLDGTISLSNIEDRIHLEPETVRLNTWRYLTLSPRLERFKAVTVVNCNATAVRSTAWT